MREEKIKFIQNRLTGKFGLVVKPDASFCGDKYASFKIYTTTGILIGETECREFDPQSNWETNDSLFGKRSGMFLCNDTVPVLEEIKREYFATFSDAVKTETEEEKKEKKRKALHNEMISIKSELENVACLLRTDEKIYRCSECDSTLREGDLVKVRRCPHCDTTFVDTEGRNCPDCNRPFTSVENEMACPNCESAEDTAEQLSREDLELMVSNLKLELRRTRKELTKLT